MDTNQDRITSEVTARFFEALNALKERGLIRGKQTFTDCYGINRWNLNSVQKGGQTQKYAQPAWLSYLVRDCGVSGTWLLTGEGEMFDREPHAPIPQEGVTNEKTRRTSRQGGSPLCKN